jgi:hypothetical protein
MIADELVECVRKKAQRRTAEDVRIGLGYTAVRLDDGSCGLTFTFRDEAAECCSVLREAGSMAGRRAIELAEWVRSPEAIPAAVGLATVNALIPEPVGAREADVARILQAGPDDVVGMVGYFAPLVDELRNRTKALHIFERRAHGEAELLPDWETVRILPECSVVILSATALINRTMDDLLERCTTAREIAIVGPSTPLLPRVFAKRRVTLLSGVRVVDAERVLSVVSEGGGTRQFGRAVQKLCLRIAHQDDEGQKVTFMPARV